MSNAMRKWDGLVAILSGASRALSLGLSVAALSGCADIDDPAWDEEGEEEELGTAELAGEPIGHNDITPEVLRLKLLAGVTPGKLCINTNTPGYCEITGAWDTWQNATYPAEKGELLKAMVRCAMPEGYSVYVPGFDPQGFPGTFGLLPGWKTNALTTAQQEILSGCVIALINAHGASVPIALIGPFAAALPEQPAAYQEAVFYGNLFWQSPVQIACGGIQEDGGNRVIGRNKRVCGDSGNPCRVTAIGACNGAYVQGQSGYCSQWIGSGDGRYCAAARDDGSKQWNYPSTIYLKTQPPLTFDTPQRCGFSGSEPCF